jgi:hypothetical protein
MAKRERPAVKWDRIMIWRFTDAPQALQSLHRESEIPEWLTLVPRALAGTDLDVAILGGAKSGKIARYETPDGDIVYVGT